MSIDLEHEPHPPRISAGIETLRCTECGWEAVFALPEESFRALISLLDHFKRGHGIKLPMIEGTSH